MTKCNGKSWLTIGTAKLFLLLPLSVDAAEINSADTAWILTAAGLALFMTVPGVALYYGGLVRTKNVLSILMQSFAITVIVSLLWVIVAYSLALTEGGNYQAFIGGFARAFMLGIKETAAKGNLPEAAFAMYHLTFAVFAPALMVGGIAERMRFGALLWFAALWLLLVYVPVCHWLWGGGWLAELGVLDFAGGIVVHTSAGVATLIAAFCLGPRRGFPTAIMAPHNLTMSATGAGILWVGWHGFSAGSALMASGAAALAMINTHIAATAGAFIWMVIEWWRFGRPTVLGIITGMVAGLGVISAGAGYIGPGAAFIIGCLSGIGCFIAIDLIKHLLGIDDALDVFPVHGIGGILGAILTGFFASEKFAGVGIANLANMGYQVMMQVLGVGVVICWSAVISYLILKLVDLVVGLRVVREQELEGLDVSLHNGSGYNL